MTGRGSFGGGLQIGGVSPLNTENYKNGFTYNTVLIQRYKTMEEKRRTYDIKINDNNIAEINRADIRSAHGLDVPWKEEGYKVCIRVFGAGEESALINAMHIFSMKADAWLELSRLYDSFIGPLDAKMNEVRAENE